MSVLKLILALLRGLLASRAALVAENLALRQQLNVLRRSVRRPRLRRRDRVFWVCHSLDWCRSLKSTETSSVGGATGALLTAMEISPWPHGLDIPA